MPFSDEEFAAHKPGQTMPIGGGRTADHVGKWDLKGDKSTAWSVMFKQDAHASCVCTLPAHHPLLAALSSTFCCMHSRLPSRHAYQQACMRCTNT